MATLRIVDVGPEPFEAFRLLPPAPTWMTATATMPAGYAARGRGRPVELGEAVPAPTPGLAASPWSTTLSRPRPLVDRLSTPCRRRGRGRGPRQPLRPRSWRGAPGHRRLLRNAWLAPRPGQGPSDAKRPCSTASPWRMGSSGPSPPTRERSGCAISTCSSPPRRCRPSSPRRARRGSRAAARRRDLRTWRDAASPRLEAYPESGARPDATSAGRRRPSPPAGRPGGRRRPLPRGAPGP